MYTEEKNFGLINTVISRITLLVFIATTILFPGWVARGQTSSEPASSIQQSNSTASHTHMSEALRSSVKKVVVVAGQSPSDQEVKGTYDQETPGLIGGMNEGQRIGNIPTEIGGVAVNFPIPILTIPGAIFGGLTGASQRRVQDFRDALTDELANAENPQLTNTGLALDVYSGIRKLPNLDANLFAPTTPVPNDTDAVLYVGFNNIEIDVQEDEAIITTSAKATLRRLSDGSDLYEKEVEYQDRATLESWTDNANALWRAYANFARHYFGREISAEVFGRVDLRHELRPKKSDTVARVKKNDWQGVSKSTSPTLAWELTLLGDDSYGSWADAIDESDIHYDVEIYDLHRLIYAEKQVPDPLHTLEIEIDACKTYRWSVRPSYYVDGDIKFGQWMTNKSDTDTGTGTEIAIIGRNASEAPAYIQDFAILEIKCGRR